MGGDFGPMPAQNYLSAQNSAQNSRPSSIPFLSPKPAWLLQCVPAPVRPASATATQGTPAWRLYLIPSPELCLLYMNGSPVGRVAGEWFPDAGATPLHTTDTHFFVFVGALGGEVGCVAPLGGSALSAALAFLSLPLNAFPSRAHHLGSMHLTPLWALCVTSQRGRVFGAPRTRLLRIARPVRP